MDRVLDFDATRQAELVRGGEISAAELVDAAIARIDRVNPQLNAVVTRMDDEARRVAAAASPDGPFAGVPFLLKDLVAEYAGVRLSEGSALLGDRYISARDSELVVRLKRAGAIVIGKTNTAEFGLLPTAEPALFGAARNPWDLSRTTGGSSGGSAAAVAAGIVAMAHANDGGGSIRIPAACCGLFGLKPTRARNPLGPFYGDMISGLVAEHAVTRSVRDSAALLDALAGPTAGDPYAVPAPARPYREEVGADPGRLRIAVSAAPIDGVDNHPDCTTAVADVAALCAELGHEVVEARAEIDWRQVNRCFATHWLSFCAWAIRDWARKLNVTPTEDDVETATWAMFQRAERLTAADYLLAVQDGQAITRQVADFMTDIDLWLTPTQAMPPVPLGSFAATADDPVAGARAAGAFAPYTQLCNITGQPAMSMPLNWNDDGLPIGTHFAARYGDEATLFRLAAQLEQARPWAHRRPPVWSGDATS